MRYAGVYRLFVPILGLELIVSNGAVAFQTSSRDDASSFRTITSANSERKKSLGLFASLLGTDLKGKAGESSIGADDNTSRRNVLLSAFSAATVAAGAISTWTDGKETDQTDQTSIPSSSSAAGGIINSVEQAIAWIDENCDRRFIHAVVAGDYQFLYRGVDDSNTISIRNEEQPDLLLPETYGSQEAAEYFRQLEEVLKDDAVRPSNGHLATTSAQDAAAWGSTAAIIWPMGPAHYAWFQDGGLFYPRREEGAGMLLDRKQIIVDGRDCGKDSLDDALKGRSWEIMVATPCFLTVPLSMEKELKDGLRNSFLV